MPYLKYSDIIEKVIFCRIMLLHRYIFVCIFVFQSVLPNKYDALAIYHRDTQNSAHGGVAFAGWHRFYLVL